MHIKKDYRSVLVLLAFTAMMTMFIEMMLVPALPYLSMEFSDNTEWISWILSIYLLVGAVANPIVGKLGDMHGRKRMLLITMSIYALALLGCSFSQTFEELLFFRAVQGVGLAMFPLAYGIIRDTFPKEKVPVAIGLVSAMFSIGVSIGLLGGGWIVSQFDWQYCYYLVTPLFILLIPLYHLLIDDGGVKGESRNLDMLGAFLLSTCVLSILLALTLWETSGIDMTIIVLLSIYAIASLVLFVLHEQRVDEPLIKLSLLWGRGAGAHVTAFVFGISMFLLFQILPYFLMTPADMGGFEVSDTFQVGLIMLPVAIMGLIVGPLSGRWCRNYGSSPVLTVGMGLFALGILMMILFHATILEILVAISVAGIGNALVMVSMINVVVETSPAADFGIASGMNTLFRVIGGSIGPVLGTTILAGFTVDWMVAPGVFVETYTITGYVWTWALAFVVMLIGTAAAALLRVDRE